MRLYAVREKSTGKLVTGLTNPSHKFWERKSDCENAVRRANRGPFVNGAYTYTNLFDMVTFELELVEVKEDASH